jgi:hypothetical protein
MARQRVAYDISTARAQHNATPQSSADYCAPPKTCHRCAALTVKNLVAVEDKVELAREPALWNPLRIDERASLRKTNQSAKV